MKKIYIPDDAHTLSVDDLPTPSGDPIRYVCSDQIAPMMKTMKTVAVLTPG